MGLRFRDVVSRVGEGWSEAPARLERSGSVNRRMAKPPGKVVHFEKANIGSSHGTKEGDMKHSKAHHEITQQETIHRVNVLVHFRTEICCVLYTFVRLVKSFVFVYVSKPGTKNTLQRTTIKTCPEIVEG